jgi:hypothetical protein
VFGITSIVVKARNDVDVKGMQSLVGRALAPQFSGRTLPHVPWHSTQLLAGRFRRHGKRLCLRCW